MEAYHGRVRKAVDHDQSELVLGNRAANLMQGEQCCRETDNTVLERVEIVREYTRRQRPCVKDG